MSVLLVEKTDIPDPMKWFCDTMGFQGEWEKDPHLKGYQFADHGDIFYYCDNGDYYRFEDFSNYNFVYWETKTWLDLAQNREIIYGHFSDDELSAEFIHIKDGKCIREFREYFDDADSNVDLGTLPEFASWVDVASYVEQM
ncbi:MAG: hypothetical protein K2N44_01465 [Lachnospiraceae bacterium]|nr:hypothetical protein [Lachnospiraceae bacterium]